MVRRAGEEEEEEKEEDEGEVTWRGSRRDEEVWLVAQETLVEELAVQKKPLVERKKGRLLWRFLSSERRLVDGGGCVVVVHNGSEVVVAEEAARTEDEDDNGRKNRGKANFSSTLACNFLDFGLQFPHAQDMESSPIYRGWKRNILSLLMPNLGSKSLLIQSYI